MDWNNLLPIAVIHVIIENLRSVGQRGCSHTWGNAVQSAPECLQNFSVHHPCPFNEAGCKSEETRILVAMDMKHADSLFKVNGGKRNITVASCKMLAHLLVVLTDNVIDLQQPANSDAVSGFPSLRYWIVDALLLFTLDKINTAWWTVATMTSTCMHRDACDVFDPRSRVRIQNRPKATFQRFTGIFLTE